MCFFQPCRKRQRRRGTARVAVTRSSPASRDWGGCCLGPGHAGQQTTTNSAGGLAGAGRRLVELHTHLIIFLQIRPPQHGWIVMAGTSDVCVAVGSFHARNRRSFVRSFPAPAGPYRRWRRCGRAMQQMGGYFSLAMYTRNNNVHTGGRRAREHGGGRQSHSVFSPCWSPSMRRGATVSQCMYYVFSASVSVRRDPERAENAADGAPLLVALSLLTRWRWSCPFRSRRRSRSRSTIARRTPPDNISMHSGYLHACICTGWKGIWCPPLPSIGVG